MESVEFVAPDYAVWPPASHANPVQGLEVPADESICGRFWDAFSEGLTVVPQRRKKSSSPSSSMDPRRVRLFLGAIKGFSDGLISPQFLYLIEPSDENLGARKLTDFEVASRLSYFLWSTMPDEELLQLAEKGRLLKGRN